MLKEKIKIGIMGGDGRQAVVTSLLSERNAECAVWGFPFEGIDFDNERKTCPVKCAAWRCAVMGASAIILPLPVTVDGVRLNCRAAENGMAGEYGVRLFEIIEEAEKGTLILAGKVPAALSRFAGEKGKKLRDYYESEEFQIKNAVPTAEGAIATACETLPFTLFRSKVAVTGYGRIGRTLAQRLMGTGADVTCIARSRKDLSWAWVDGCKTIPLEEYKNDPDKFDVIFNTVPHVIFDGGVIPKIDAGTVYIELASRDGGIDLKAAEDYGIIIIKAPSLPGRFFPQTAGEIMFDSVFSILREEAIL